MADSSSNFPPDPALPAASELLDVDRARRLLRRADPQPMGNGGGVGGGANVGELRLRYVDYRPGRRLVVLYRDDRGAEYVAVADSVGGVGIADNHVTLHRYPHDPQLVHLADPAAALVALLGQTSAVDGVRRVEEVGAVAVERLAWVPLTRAVVAIGGVVLKMYAEPADASAALAAMAARPATLPSAPVVAADEPRGLVVFERLTGQPLGRDAALAAVESAADLLVTWQMATIDRPVLTPDDLLVSSTGPRELVGFARQELGERLEQIVERLRREVPAGVESVVCHGDFNVGQLLATSTGLALVDLDTACRAPRGFDEASYAANLVAGRPGDLELASRVLDELCVRTGADRQVAQWLLVAVMLRRVDRPIRRFKRSWPRRVTALVTDLERAIVGTR